MNGVLPPKRLQHGFLMKFITRCWETNGKSDRGHPVLNKNEKRYCSRLSTLITNF